MNSPVELTCFAYGQKSVAGKLQEGHAPSFLFRSSVSRFPVVDDIPRFVSSATCASEFGKQWTTLRSEHLRSAAQISNCLKVYQITDIETAYAGNGVKAPSRKPAWYELDVATMEQRV